MIGGHVFILFVALIASTCIVLLDGQAINNLENWIKLSGKQEQQQNDVPLAPVTDSWNSPDTDIFVSIVHFRDARCPVTLNNIFSKAKYPNRVKVGLVTQVHTEEDISDCKKAYCLALGGESKCPFASQIDRIEMSFLDARGASYARHISDSYQLNEEEFCMQIDSHTDFIKDWDVALTSMWGSTENEYAVLSTYPADISELGFGRNDGKEVPHLCEVAYTDNGVVKNLLPRTAKNLKAPILASTWSQSFSFSKCHAQLKTPNDPDLMLLLEGEDFAKYARLWTRGYDVYTPHYNVAAHDLKGVMFRSAPAMSKDNKPIDALEWMSNGMHEIYRSATFKNSIDRISLLLGSAGHHQEDATLLSTLTKFGLGNRRTIDQFIDFTGVDVRNKKLLGSRCKELEWVPFVSDVNPYSEDGNLWGLSPEYKTRRGSDIPLIDGSIDIYSISSPTHRDAAVPNSHSEDEVALKNLRKGFGASDAAGAGVAVGGRYGRLWFVLGFIDGTIDRVISFLDEKVGTGEGFRILQIMLLSAPIFFIIIFAAFYSINSSNTNSSNNEVHHVVNNSKGNFDSLKSV